MGLLITLDLGDLGHRLPPGPFFGIRAINFRTIRALVAVHQAVAEIAIMGDSEGLTTQLFFIGSQIVPQALGVGAVKHGIRHDGGRLLRSVPHDDDTVQVVTCRCRGPFESRHSGKSSGLVVVLGLVHEFNPDTACSLVGLHGIFSRNTAGSDIVEGFHAAFRAGIEPLVYPPAPLTRQ